MIYEIGGGNEALEVKRARGFLRTTSGGERELTANPLCLGEGKERRRKKRRGRRWGTP